VAGRVKRKRRVGEKKACPGGHTFFSLGIKKKGKAELDHNENSARSNLQKRGSFAKKTTGAGDELGWFRRRSISSHRERR